ncbi:ribbon-helix-helix protein, CopG family [Candidatus Magnetominusculus dajiuhuensis]|uniref:ribbon-helix-helix protein, CopG family n=1 Tax=Candidatus Magnetominusculus dajiuhuensis TaxID=3137712 RepID=UPI003B432780
MKAAKVMISAKVDRSVFDTLDVYAKELQVSKSWIVQQALKQYFDKYDEYLGDMRVASLSEGISHEDVLKEYGLPH